MNDCAIAVRLDITGPGIQVCNSDMEHIAESCQGGKAAWYQRHVNMTKYVHRKNEKLATFWGLGGLGYQMADKRGR